MESAFNEEENSGFDAIEANGTETTENLNSETEIEPVIYTGPNIFAMALQRFQVFSGGLPLYVKRAIEKIPEIEALIVPVSELENTRRKIEKPGTYESRLFAAIQKAARSVK